MTFQLAYSWNFSSQMLPLWSGEIIWERSHSTPVSHLIPLIFPCTGIPGMIPMPSDFPDIFPHPPGICRHVQAWVAKNRSDHTALWLFDITGYKTGVVRIGHQWVKRKQQAVTTAPTPFSRVQFLKMADLSPGSEVLTPKWRPHTLLTRYSGHRESFFLVQAQAQFPFLETDVTPSKMADGSRNCACAFYGA